jgi:ribosomal protein S10
VKLGFSSTSLVFKCATILRQSEFQGININGPLPFATKRAHAVRHAACDRLGRPRGLIGLA